MKKVQEKSIPNSVKNGLGWVFGVRMLSDGGCQCITSVGERGEQWREQST
jgi:hypothetical protein